MHRFTQIAQPPLISCASPQSRTTRFALRNLRPRHALLSLCEIVCLASLGIPKAVAQAVTEDPNGKVHVSFRNTETPPSASLPSVFLDSGNRPTQDAPKRRTQLGARDDSLADSYHVEGRGVETPTGNPTGRYSQAPMQRAGLPWIPNPFAAAGNSPHHSVGMVGGSTPFRSPLAGPLQGESRTRSEGVFGKDYSGWMFKRKTWLYWTHGSREQGGIGRYETDGPRILPEK
jgi:hypothetical protein